MPEPPVILNVDDNEPARYAKSRTLLRAGFVVYDAASGRECLELVSKHAPDLVLLDVNLPDLNGIEVCRNVKSSADGASVIVLQISATATAAPWATAALNSGADAYLAEPVDPEVLVATVRALLRLRTAERALALANSRLEALNRDLQESNKSLEQFAYVASHDLQEPLRTVTTFASLLERSAAPRLTTDELQYLQFIVDGASRMRALIHDLLHYSQIGESPTQSSVDLNAVFNWAAENLRELITESEAEVSAADLPSVLGDEAQLRHVFQNLLGNAIKYRRPDIPPRVLFTACALDAHWVTVRVADNGIGIDRQYWDLVFVPFKRLHGRDIPGTGIGLAVCRRVIEAHGGRISVESTLGEGSTFTFTLPAAVGADAQRC